MGTDNSRGGAFGLLRDEQYDLFDVDDQLAIFGGLSVNERRVIAELEEVAELVPGRTDRSSRRRKTMFGARRPGRPRPSKPIVFRYRGYRCRDCRRHVGPLTGICAPCHFAGWWWR